MPPNSLVTDKTVRVKQSYISTLENAKTTNPKMHSYIFIFAFAFFASGAHSYYLSPLVRPADGLRYSVLDNSCMDECGDIGACCARRGYNDGGYCTHDNAFCTNKDTFRRQEVRREECDGQCGGILECCRNELGYYEGGYCRDNQAYCLIKKSGKNRYHINHHPRLL